MARWNILWNSRKLMKTKLLKRLRKEARNRYRLHTIDGSWFWIQKFDFNVCYWYLYGTNSYPDLDSGKKALADVRRNWILAELHNNYGNRPIERINKVIHTL